MSFVGRPNVSLQVAPCGIALGDVPGVHEFIRGKIADALKEKYVGFQYLIPSTGTHRVRGRSRRHEHTGRKLHAAGTFAAAHVPIPPTS